MLGQWTRKQKIAFLGYLFLLNLVVFSAFAYLIIRSTNFRNNEDEAAYSLLPTVTPYLTPTPFLLPTTPPTLAFSTFQERLPTPTSTQTPPISIVQANNLIEESVSALDNASSSGSGRQVASQDQLGLSRPTKQLVARYTATPISTPTKRPTPTPSSTLTPTSTQTPSPTPSSTNTSTPTVTSSATSTSIPTRRPTVTKTSTPRPSATSTKKPTATVTVKPTEIQVTREARKTSTPTATSTKIVRNQQATPVAAIIPFPKTEPNDLSVAEQGTDIIVEIEPAINRHLVEWEEAKPTNHYRVYSDMGSGYGVLIYQEQVLEPKFVNQWLQQGTLYTYQINQVDKLKETNIVLTTSPGPPLSFTAEEVVEKTTESTVQITPAPTVLPADTVLLGLLSDNNYTDDFGMLTIAGEVRNDSTLNVGNTEIVITFYDASGTVIEEIIGTTIIEVLAPGTTSPFLMKVLRPTGMTRYSLRTTAQPVNIDLESQLAVVDVKRFEDDAGFFNVSGTIKNVGNITSRRTKVAVILYNRAGRVINVGISSVDPQNLEVGVEGDYNVKFTYYPRYFSQTVIPFEE